MDELADVQRYPFPVDAAGRSIRDDLQGPEYMRRQRLRVQRLGVRILDHTPAVELLVDDDGVVSGAAVLDRASGRTLRVEAAGVVLAAGGCAFQSKTLGCDVNTGDGALMAGASLSGMEFSNAYAIAVKGTSLTKTAYYSWATFYRADKTVLEGAASTRGRSVIAKTLLSEAVFARIDRASDDEQRAMRKGQPNFFLVFDRLGINPFTDFFEITLLAEGTVRGTGGVRIADYDCSTDVPGLYAAGDRTWRGRRRRLQGPRGGRDGRPRPVDVPRRPEPYGDPRYAQAAGLPRAESRPELPAAHRWSRRNLVSPRVRAAGRMIEVVDQDRCIACDRCVDVCPTRVFDRGPDGIPVIARHDSCQTCFQCEAYCPTDALFVSPLATRAPADSPFRDAAELAATGLLGGYRRKLGWGSGRALGARTAVGPTFPG
jgi:NAD-dependent dihydropyrimidine dehydrogenase PreA subunit/thioredoxin reductase